jgi:hypothetical protein
VRRFTARSDPYEPLLSSRSRTNASAVEPVSKGLGGVGRRLWSVLVGEEGVQTVAQPGSGPALTRRLHRWGISENAHRSTGSESTLTATLPAFRGRLASRRIFTGTLSELRVPGRAGIENSGPSDSAYSQRADHTVEGRRAVRARTLLPRAPGAAAPSSLLPVRKNVNLVWRRLAPTTHASAPPKHPVDIMTLAPPTAIRVSRTVSHVVPDIPNPLSQGVPKLDATLVERLADDVIRRIDKRSRIERERRGL